MKTSLATSLGKAAAFSAIALAVTAAVAQDAERPRPLVADVKINKQLQIEGQPPAGYNPQFSFNVNVTENELPKPPEGCRWEKPTYQPPGGNTTATTGGAAQVTVTNHLVCAPPCPGKELSIPLDGLSQWTKSGGGSFANVTSTNSAWIPNGGVTKWVGLSANGNAPSNASYTAQIPFCSCPLSKVDVQVTSYRVDDKGLISLIGPPAISGAPIPASNNFRVTNAAVGGGFSTVTGSTPGSYVLNNQVTNGIVVSGWTMGGSIRLQKGYLGACKI